MRRALVVDDLGESRDWLRGIVTGAFAEAEVTEAHGVRAAMEAIRRTEFDVALIDLGLPDGDGLDVLRALKRASPATMAIVTTVMAGDAQIVAALSAGADGYLLKGEAQETVARQLAQIAEGVPALSPSIARRIMRHFRQTGPTSEPEATLSARERDVLSLIARGLRVVDAASALDVAPSTVASHVKSIYRKLGISTRAEATLHATRMGLIEDGER